MSVFHDLSPLENVTLQFTEEQVADFTKWFDEMAKPLLTINDNPPIKVITIEQLMEFLELEKIHRRSFHYPSYAEVMKEVEEVKAGVLRVLTKEQFLFILNKWVLTPQIKHELLLAFQLFDSEKRNFLEIDDIKTAVTTYGDYFSENEARELLRDANVRGDGNVYYEDFIESLFNIAPELYQLEVEYLYDNADEDPSVPPKPKPKLEPEPVSLPPPPLPPPAPLQKEKKKKK